MQALVGEVRRHVHKLPASVGQAVGHDGLEFFGHDCGTDASHIWMGRPSSEARCFNTAARFSPAWRCPVKNNAIRYPSRIETIPEVNTPVRSGTSVGSEPVGSPDAAGQGQDLHRRVVIVKHLALGRLPDHLLEDRFDHVGTVLDNLPLRRGWQGDAQTPLQPFQAIERKSAPILQQRDHARRFGVILVRSHTRRRLGREDLTAQVASQLLQFIHRGPQRSLTLDPHQVARFGTSHTPCPFCSPGRHPPA